jgi:hypothetical protein
MLNNYLNYTSSLSSAQYIMKKYMTKRKAGTFISIFGAIIFFALLFNTNSSIAACGTNHIECKKQKTEETNIYGLPKQTIIPIPTSTEQISLAGASASLR